MIFCVFVQCDRTPGTGAALCCHEARQPGDEACPQRSYSCKDSKKRGQSLIKPYLKLSPLVFGSTS